MTTLSDRTLFSSAIRLWRLRWSLARLIVAGVFLWTLAAGSGSRLARLVLASMPDADAPAEIRALRDEGRYAEAVALAEASVALARPSARPEMQALRDEVEAERSSWLRRAGDAARGAIGGGTWGTRDPSLEMLAGAVVTDLFVIGDARDLIVQGLRAARGDEIDPVILALSTIGVATTLIPAADAGVSVLKAARRAGCMTDAFAREILRLASGPNPARLRRVAADTAELAKGLSPAGTARLLSHSRGLDELAHAADLVRRLGPEGVRTLHAGADSADALRLVARAGELRSAGRVSEAGAIEQALVRASAKGPAGIAAVARPGATSLLRALTRTHPLIGLAKGLWKGTLPDLIERGIEGLDEHWWWMLPACAGWVVFEAGWLSLRLRGEGSRHRRSENQSPRPSTAPC